MWRFLLYLLSLFCSLSLLAKSHSDYQMHHLQGLSNSAVLYIHQDSAGIMWFGTYDGLNSYDGKNIEVCRADFSKGKTLDNNIISRIQPADNGNLWVQSFSGINLFSPRDMTVIENYEFPHEETMIYADGNGHSWVVGNRNIYYYHPESQRFVHADTLAFACGRLGDMAYMDRQGDIYLIPLHGTEMHRFHLKADGKSPTGFVTERHRFPLHDLPIGETYYHNGILCFIDGHQDLYMYDVNRSAKIYIRNIALLKQRYGNFIDIISYHGELIITLMNGGILRLQSSDRYREELIRSELRVFSVYMDARQDILWLGTDGQGAVKLYDQQRNIHNLIMEKMAPGVNGQVRGILTDSLGNLWLGTKGDGLMKIAGYRDEGTLSAWIYLPGEKVPATAYSRHAAFMPVFSLKASRHRKELFWVGMTDTVLHYYSYRDDRLMAVEGALASTPFEVHGIHEENDSTLWIATTGNGILRVTLDGQGLHPKVKRKERIQCFWQGKELVEFSCLLVRGDSLAWFGSRGFGIVRVNMKTGAYRVLSLKQQLAKAVDDVLCLCNYADNRFFVGTTAGMVDVCNGGVRRWLAATSATSRDYSTT